MDKITKKEIEQLKELEEYQKEIEQQSRDEAQDDQQDSQFEFQEGYGGPEPEQNHNSHTFLNQAAFVTPDTLRVTNLDKDELGKPIFNVRFLLDMEDISDFYLAELCDKYKTQNKIAEYFRQKIINITDSGMSKEGFTMMLNTTKNVNLTRTRHKGNIENLKGGKRR